MLEQVSAALGPEPDEPALTHYRAGEPGWHLLEVLLDGQRVERAWRADAAAGTVEQVQTNRLGIVPRGEKGEAPLRTVTRRGQVTIRRKET